jgi:hypothetical protein
MLRIKVFLLTMSFFFSVCNAQRIIENSSSVVTNNVSIDSADNFEPTVQIATDENGNPLFWVLGEIVNTFLPDAANWVCLKIIGKDNEKICDGISEGIAFITSLSSTGKSVRKIIGETVELIAQRGSSRSSIKFITSSLETALNIKSTLDAYQKLKAILWEEITDNINRMNSYIGSVTITNKVKRTVQLNFSKDGIEWVSYFFYPGNSIDVNFWKGYFKQSYGFCTGNSFCNYQVFTDKAYQIRYSKVVKQYYLESL